MDWGGGIIKLEVGSGKFLYLGEEISEAKLKELLVEQLYVVQRGVKQHRELDRFCSASVNTLRINTIMQDGGYELLSAFMRIGVGDSYVDNWDLGSLLVDIEKDSGKLLGKGFSKPQGLILKSYWKHPKSGISFDGFQIPHYQEAVETALRCHKFYYSRFILAFDFAITQQGPVVIEVNSTPHLQMMQLCCGGLKELVNKSIK